MEHSVSSRAADKTLVVRKQVPAGSAVPAILEHTHVKSWDAVSQKPRSKADLKKVHTSARCQIALRTIHELFKADQRDYLEAVRFAGYVDATDPPRGGKWSPVVLTLSMRKEPFRSIRLDPFSAGQLRQVHDCDAGP